MKRHDLYGAVHKALRAELFEAAVLVGRADFTVARDREETTLRLRRVLAFLDEHARHEDDVLLPELGRIAPELGAQLRSDHSRIDGLQRELRGFAERLQGATGAESNALGRRLHERMGRLVAEHLLHMDREETLGNRGFWAHRTDAELREIEARVVGSIPSGRLAEWLEIVLRAANPAERQELEAQGGVGS